MKVAAVRARQRSIRLLLSLLPRLGLLTETVELLEEDNNKEIEYRIVGEDEADIKHGLISYTSPIARALIGKSEGDIVSFQAPGGEKTFEILEVKYI